MHRHRSPAPQVQETRDSHAVDIVDTWSATLPIDLILEIFVRLEPAAVIRCAGVCKPWRRAIIGNASILGAHLDHLFGPSLLLGIFQYDRTASCLWCMPGPFQSVLPSNGGRPANSGCGRTVTLANNLIPAAASAALSTLLWLMDGFILLAGRSGDSLCLCNPMTGHCLIFPASPARHNTYILLTSDEDDNNPAPAGRILAVHRKRDITIFDADEETLAYQLMSTSGHMSGMWGAVVQCSGDELQAGGLRVSMDPQSTAVGRDCVYWLAGPGTAITCVLGLDVRTGRTWTTELPVQCHSTITVPITPILSMSSNGRLLLIESLWGLIIQVWVLCRGQWTCQWTIQMDAQTLLSHCPPRRSHCCPTCAMPSAMYLTASCPRSRCVIIIWSDQEFLVDIDESGSSHPRVRHMSSRNGYYCWPYEMDSSSTYISKMKNY